MPTVFVPKVLTANRLRDGRVVFLDKAGVWASQLGEATVARDEAAVQVLTAAIRGCAAEAVEPYLIDVLGQADGSWQPVEMRERRRVHGPSVGPQASTRCSSALQK